MPTEEEEVPVKRKKTEITAEELAVLQKQAKLTKSQKQNCDLNMVISDPILTSLLDNGQTKKYAHLIKNISEKHDQAKLQRLFPILSEEQLDRYEYFRRSHFQRSTVKKVVSQATGISITQPATSIVLAGITKIFAGEIITTALQIRNSETESTPKPGLKPSHIREAFRRIKNDPDIYHPDKQKSRKIF